MFYYLIQWKGDNVHDDLAIAIWKNSTIAGHGKSPAAVDSKLRGHVRTMVASYPGCSHFYFDERPGYEASTMGNHQQLLIVSQEAAKKFALSAMTGDDPHKFVLQVIPCLYTFRTIIVNKKWCFPALLLSFA